MICATHGDSFCDHAFIHICLIHPNLLHTQTSIRRSVPENITKNDYINIYDYDPKSENILTRVRDTRHIMNMGLSVFAIETIYGEMRCLFILSVLKTELTNSASKILTIHS